jgi:hypothetical protein
MGTVMSHRRIGQLIGTLVPLSDQDVEEVLEEQNLSRRPFGDIAVEWGLCKPGHVWKAWATQDDNPPLSVDLEKIGIDAQATADFPRELALRCGAIPIRMFEDLLVIAVKNADAQAILEEHVKSRGRHVAIVIAPNDQIDTAIHRYYGAAAAA